MRRRWPWIDRNTAFWAFMLGQVWLWLAVMSWLHQDWVTGAIQALTGIVLVASTLRVRLAVYRADRAKGAYEEAAQRSNRALWLCLTLMHHIARQEQTPPDAEDLARHSLN